MTDKQSVRLVSDRDIRWCNWVFAEFIDKGKWLVQRDCSDEITVSSGDGRNWKAYKASLQPHPQFTHPADAKCPNCGGQVNGVNPYDDGQTWRR